MLHNRRRNDGIGYANGLDMSPYNRPPEPPVQPNLLDNTNERMLDMAETIGLLSKEVEMLNEDNQRLEQENQESKKRVAELHSRNVELEREDSASQSARESAQEIVNAAINILQERKK